MREGVPRGPTSIRVVGVGREVDQVRPRAAATPASIALSIAIRSAAGSTRTASVPRTTGRPASRSAAAERSRRVGRELRLIDYTCEDATIPLTPIRRGGRSPLDARGPIGTYRGHPDERRGAWQRRGRGETTPQGDDVVGRVRRRTGEPGVPDRGARRLDRRPRHHRRVRAVDDLGLPRRAAEQHPRRAGDACSRTSPAASRCTRTRRGASTSPSWARSRRSATGSAGRSCSSINGLVAGTLIQAEWFSDYHVGRGRGRASTSRLPIVLGIVLIIAGLVVQRLRGAAGGVVRLRDRRAAAASRRSCSCSCPTSRATGRAPTWSGTIGAGGGLAAGAHVALLHVLVGVRDRGGGERSRPSTTTPSATRRGRCARRALFSVVVYALLPLGLGGTLGTAAIAEDATLHRLLPRRLRHARRQRARPT